jgi:hypothetical protein
MVFQPGLKKSLWALEDGADCRSLQPDWTIRISRSGPEKRAKQSNVQVIEDTVNTLITERRIIERFRVSVLWAFLLVRPHYNPQQRSKSQHLRQARQQRHKQRGFSEVLRPIRRFDRFSTVDSRFVGSRVHSIDRKGPW